MKRISAVVITIFLIIIMLSFSSAIVGNIHKTYVNESMGPLWNNIMIYMETTMNLMTPIVLILGIGLLGYALCTLLKRR